MNNRRKLLVALGAGTLVAPFATFAQQQGKVWRVGILEVSPALVNAPQLDGFRNGMRDLGYVEGKNLVIEYRSADGRAERFAALATELARLNVDAFVTRGAPATVAAKNASATIPIVMAAIADPLAVIASLSRPGGNITGFGTNLADLQGKRVELLVEMIPAITRVGLLMNERTSTISANNWKGVEKAARSKGIQAQSYEVKNSDDLRLAFAAASNQRTGAMIVGLDTVLQSNKKLIVELAAKYKVPTIYSSGDFVDAGGLIAYSPNYPDLYRRAAIFVDKIFKGAKPADMPTEQPTKFELVVNAKAAKALGLTIPQVILFRVDRMIE